MKLLTDELDFPSQDANVSSWKCSEGWKLMQHIALSENQEEAFLVCETRRLANNVVKWKKAFPNVNLLFGE